MLKLIPKLSVVVFKDIKAFCISTFLLKKILREFFKKLLLNLVFKGSGIIGFIILECISFF